MTPVHPDALVIALDDPGACEHALTGGKGANLARLVQAGLPVPGGFVVSTDGYAAFLSEGVDDKIRRLLNEIDYDQVASVEAKSAEIRALLAQIEMPAGVAHQIEAAYREIGNDAYVAVRSSGTAEDLEGTSFAGLHDTYLDVVGAGAVIEAVKRCWGSLWTARACMYRFSNDFDHLQARLAVVVQEMVDADASGVMFTANPRTGATDETVINASWGLGEAVVQGIVTPDEFTVKAGVLRIDGDIVAGSQHVLERSLGNKEKRFVRNPDTHQGTIVEPTPDDLQGRYSLSDPQIAELAALGRRVMKHYDELPQDIEWALAGEQLYLLQSRPITGVEMSWDADLNHGHQITSYRYPPEDPFAIRMRGLADEAWTGPVTPLMYSWRGNQWNQAFWDAAVRLGREDLLARTPVNYYKGYVYADCVVEQALFCECALPMARPGSLDKLPASWHEQAMAAPFSVFDWVKQQLKLKTTAPRLFLYGWFEVLEDYMTNRIAEAEGLPDEQLPALDDDELKQYIEQQIMFEEQYNRDVSFPGFFMHSRDAMTALGQICARWYTGENPEIFAHLLAGTPRPTASVVESIELARLGEEIRESPQVRAAFERHRDQAFIDQLEASEQGRAFRSQLDGFLAKSGHRGHADRDIYFKRYVEDPAALYNALEAHVRSGDDPLVHEQRNTAVRATACEDMIESLKRQPLGFAKVEAFKFVHDYCLRFLMIRDDERHFIDRNTFSIRKAFLEVNRRLIERGLLDGEDDFWFLGWHELFDVLDGRGNRELDRRKIEGRRRNFDRWHRKEIAMPKFIRRNQPFDDAGASKASV
ncbi:MAG: PEP/pyruvate-binding domain-containing protein, partial [Solirubrobacteraceae bacterium]